MSLQGKTVMITGASRGIGASAAQIFAEEGANVVLLARSADKIEMLAKEIGNQAFARACDISDQTDFAAAVSEGIDKFGKIDVLINNAGVVEPISHMATADPTDWGTTIDINLKGVFYGMHAVLPGMIAAGGGTILSVSSGAAHGPVEAWSAYCASKAGAAMLTRSLDKEYRDKGIRAMGLSPGTVATQMQREIKASGINPISKLEWTDHIPPEWPAKCLLWMCSPEADEFLGEELGLRDEGLRRRLGLIS